MEGIFIPAFAILMLAAPVASFVWLIGRIRGGLTSKRTGIALYAGCSALPVLAYVGLFFVLLGVEELFDASLIGEGYARSLLILAAGGLAWVALGTVIFSIVVRFVPNQAS